MLLSSQHIKGRLLRSEDMQSGSQPANQAAEAESGNSQNVVALPVFLVWGGQVACAVWVNAAEATTGQEAWFVPTNEGFNPLSDPPAAVSGPELAAKAGCPQDGWEQHVQLAMEFKGLQPGSTLQQVFAMLQPSHGGSASGAADGAAVATVSAPTTANAAGTNNKGLVGVADVMHHLQWNMSNGGPRSAPDSKEHLMTRSAAAAAAVVAPSAAAPRVIEHLDLGRAMPHPPGRRASVVRQQLAHTQLATPIRVFAAGPDAHITAFWENALDLFILAAMPKPPGRVRASRKHPRLKLCIPNSYNCLEPPQYLSGRRMEQMAGKSGTQWQHTIKLGQQLDINGLRLEEGKSLQEVFQSAIRALGTLVDDLGDDIMGGVVEDADEEEGAGGKAMLMGTVGSQQESRDAGTPNLTPSNLPSAASLGALSRGAVKNMDEASALAYARAQLQTDMLEAIARYDPNEWVITCKRVATTGSWHFIYRWRNPITGGSRGYSSRADAVRAVLKARERAWKSSSQARGGSTGGAPEDDEDDSSFVTEEDENAANFQSASEDEEEDLELQYLSKRRRRGELPAEAAQEQEPALPAAPASAPPAAPMLPAAPVMIIPPPATQPPQQAERPLSRIPDNQLQLVPSTGFVSSMSLGHADKPNSLSPLPELHLVGDQLPLSTLSMAMSSLGRLLRELGHARAITQLLQLHKAIGGAGQQGMTDFVISYALVRDAVAAQDGDAARDLIAAGFSLQL